MEIWDLYDREGNRTGDTWERKFRSFQDIPMGKYHLVVDILVRHKDGTYLIMKRDENKDVYPGYWEASAGGSAITGEEPFEAAQRELFEETGLKGYDYELINVSFSDKSHSMFYSYVCETDADKDSIVLQEGETTDYKWVDRAGLIEYLDSDTAIKSHNERNKKYMDRVRFDEILSKRPAAPWAGDIPEGDFVTPYPTYPTGKILDKFAKHEFEDASGVKLKYYTYDPTEHGFSKDGKYPVLIFFHGTSNSFVDDLCINYTGAELYGTDKYQEEMGGAYIIVPVANEYRGDDGRVKGYFGVDYLEPVHNLTTKVIAEFGESAGPKFILGNSSGASFVFRLMDAYTDDYDVLFPVGSTAIAEESLLDKLDEKDKYLFFAIAKRDEFHSFTEEVEPWLDRLSKMKHCFIFTPEWTRNGDKGIASIEGGIEMGQHCLMNAIQANLMFDDGTPMEERLPGGVTAWIKEVTEELLNR
jgi:8-oxo-dGTP pyrophosphatase MutT (NUDIX family)